ncbi:MAG: DUF945 family protein [Spirochaetales bacterium]|jgi:uncharacterized protein YdgA (DUF945 family)|nr:DUF945 family protein [Spirochaetales bacterium]
MKKVLVAPLILALLVVGSYGIFGVLAKRNFDNAMEHISAQVPGQIDITYKQGFLSSTVSLHSQIPMADNDQEVEISASTSHTIYHGPFVFHAMQDDQPAYIPIQAYTEGNLFYELSGLLDPTLAQGIKDATNTTISAYITLMGDAHLKFSGEPLIEECDLDGTLVAIDWQGFNGSLISQCSFRDFTYDVTAPGLVIAGDGPEQFELGPITSSGTAHSGNFDIGLGTHKVNIKNIGMTFSADPGDNVRLTNMDIKVILNEQDGLLRVSEYFDMEALSINNKSYGPANLTFHARNLDAKALSLMNQEYIELQKNNRGNTDAMQAQLMQMASTHGLTLLSKSPEFEFENISLTTVEGSGELKLKLRFNGEGEVIMNPLFLLGRLEAEASLGADERFLAVLAKDLLKQSLCVDANDTTCDKQAARASNEQLQQLLLNNQLILENDRFISTISYKDGAATLNGKPMPLF